MSKPRCEQVICLSDSGESVRSAMNEADKDDADFNFPPVDFTYHEASRATIDKPTEEVNETPSLDQESASRLSELLGKYSDKRQTTRQPDRKRKNKHKKTRGTSAESDSHDDDGESDGSSPITEAALNRRGTGSRRKESERSNVVGETREKSPTRAEKQCQKNLQPGEALKLVSICMDKGLKKFDFQSSLLAALRESDVSFKVDSLPIENSIMWMRSSEDEAFARTNSLAEKEILVVWNFDETVRRVKDGSFASSVESIATLIPDAKIILVLYGTERYFEYRSNSAKQRSKNGRCSDFDDLPKVSKEDLEICLAEVQLLVDCNSVLVDTSHDVNALVRRLTKAIAERPFKLNKRQRFDGMEWYAMGDNRDTVRVDKNGNGLKRLWRHQLRQFSLASLEASEAISSVYPSPFKLMQAYGSCTLTEGEQLLSEILVRRAAGPLSTVRKVGPDMSKKIFIAFTSKDGDTLVDDR